MKSRVALIFLTLVLIFTLSVPALAISGTELDAAVTASARYMAETVTEPRVDSIGGEWAVLGLARSGYTMPDSYYQGYYNRVVEYVQECQGILHTKKYTEYSRVIVALSSISKDARDVGGYDLLKPLGDYDMTIWQGLNGPIWALIALDSRNYPMPQNPEARTQATRQMYIDRILDCQLSDGGWSLFGGTEMATTMDLYSDPDITGMALQALAGYMDQPAVAKAVGEAVERLSKMQAADGGFSTYNTANCESAAQVIVGLCALGIDPATDSRFIKNGISVVDNFISFRNADGSFWHTHDPNSGDDQMTTEQGLYTLVAMQRLKDGKNSLYSMSDALTVPDAPPQATVGLPGKHEDVKRVPVTAPGTSFSDAETHDNSRAIEALAIRGIINGMGDGTFAPDATMTRAQFAAITVRALGLEAKANGKFADVPASAWYAGWIGTANTYGIVNGRSETSFDPNGTITRQEAATMVARAAKLCGMDTDYGTAEIRDVLAQFGDYIKTADWARSSLAFCYDKGILDDSALDIEPLVPIKRCEIAQMIFNMLDKAKLL